MPPRYSFDDVEESLNNGPVSLPEYPRYQQSSARAFHPGAHPDSVFARSRNEGQNSRSPPEIVSPVSPPLAPIHREGTRYQGQQLGYNNSIISNTTPGADNFSESAAGGMAGIAMSVAEQNARESGLEAERGIPGYDNRYQGQHDPYRGSSSIDEQHSYGHTTPYDDPRHHQQTSYNPQNEYGQMSPYENERSFNHPPPTPQHGALQPPYRPQATQANSQSSLMPLGAAAVPPATTRTPELYPSDPYFDSPFKRYSGNRHPGLGALDPNSIEDDGDDGLEYTHHNRNSMLSLGNNSQRSGNSGSALPKAAAAGGVLGALGGLVSRNASGAHPEYGMVSTGGPNTGYDHTLDREVEKSEWLNKQKKSTHKWRWVLLAILILAILGGIGGGLAAYFLNKKNSPAPSSTQTASGDTEKNGDLSKDSPEIKALLNNKNLHKVFPGIDYTPINTQFPDCLANPASQNNVTRDIAVLSQLTNQIRLYGTDCNQTEMVMHAIDRLGLNGTVKVWLGVWQATNDTTNARQLEQMYTILDTYGTAPFKGAIVGNECIFREDMTVSALATILTNVKSNFTSKGYDLSVSTSDIGVSWTQELATVSDYVMANIHPFFSGVPFKNAADWTTSFWQGSIFPFKPDLTKNIIAETGWPSEGGTDCGSSTVTSCPDGSVASIDGMNQFMSDFVCQALTNGTQFFMFEAFDEPWKVMFNTENQNWEDKWGLMDVNRNLKSGLQIPDCGGKTVPDE